MEARRQALIEANLPLVDHVVRKIAGSFPGFVDRQELASAGRLGLTEAAIRYEFDRGAPFAPFAARRIRGAVLDLLRQNDWVPRSIRETARRADGATHTLHHRLGRTPEDHEVAAAIGVDVGELRDTRQAVAHGALGTIDGGSGDDDPLLRLVDPGAMGPDERIEHRELQGYLRAALDNLPERLRLIVVGHYLDGQSLDDIAQVLGITPSRVSQLRADAIEIIRDGIVAQFRGDDTGPTAAPKGRVAIRQAQYAAAVASHADWRTRLLTGRYDAPVRLLRPSPPAEDHVA